MTATIHQAKTHLSKLIQRALAGDEVVIAKRDQPLVRLQPLNQTRRSRVGGLKHWKAGEPNGFDGSKIEREVQSDFLRRDPDDPLLHR